MPYTITKGTKSRKQFLGFDDGGNHEWKESPLDAIRFTTDTEVRECCAHLIATGATVTETDPWDGHYETYRDYEIQIYRDNLRGMMGGKRWRYRIGPIASDRAFEYSSGNLGYTSPGKAIEAAKTAVNKRK